MEGGDAKQRSHAAPLSFRKSERIEAVWLERGRGRASRGKFRFLYTLLGGACIGAFQVFSVKYEAIPGRCLLIHLSNIWTEIAAGTTV